jgi:pimeloyl-ACP methyl ester carboxylesterase
MPYIKHKFGQTWFQAKGKKTKKLPIIALHGGPGGTHVGMKALFDLANERKVYLYDQIGSGKSSITTKKHWTIKTFVEELKLLKKSMGY